MTIDELIAELQRRREMHGGRTEVLITWESTRQAIGLRDIYLGRSDLGRARKDAPPLLIDADFSDYKEAFQHPDDVKNNPPLESEEDDE
jgi:hypothetical protein